MLYSLSLVHTKRISHCGTQAGEYITNPEATCRTLYPTIYCNGDGSAYCTEMECLEEYECASAESPATVATTTTTPAPPTRATTPTPSTTAESTTTSLSPTTASSTTTAQVTSIPTSAVMRAQCKLGVILREPYRGNCRYYYACNNGYFQIQDCGFFRVFDVIDKICKMQGEAKCWRDM
ncbi:integumentary mucin C.1 [Ceratitis capitata]|uniref:integumentary mucin C.1 n=1 Tax=Ceratitis capitata TaxID=7213 RepID=UPI000329EA9F|nr:integumentary mucin C.1 [Ceratitis capitata]